MLILSGTISVIALQSLLIAIDEFICHQKRSLGKWERWGHPLDSFVFGVTTTLPAFFIAEGAAFYLYIGLAVFSSLLITKDEWVHSRECDGFESWLHSLLFLFHIATLFCIGIVWKNNQLPLLRLLMPFFIFAWGSYQLIYWNVLKRGSGINEVQN